MCHHYVSAKDPPPWVHLVPEFSEIRIPFNPQKLIWPLAAVPVVRLDSGGGRELVECEWGLLPRWWRPSGQRVKRTGFQRKTINAVSEEIATKPSYREAFQSRRCLLPASEFHELGHYFHLPDRQTFMLAGVWETWRGGDETVDSCTMLTTTANDLVRSVGQDRMPVVFTTRNQCDAWLTEDPLDLNRRNELLRPASEGVLECYKEDPRS